MPNIDDLYEGEMDIDSLMQCGHHHTLNHIMAKAMAKPKEGIPYQYRDVLKYPLEEQEKWNKACRDEIVSIEERNIWSLVDCPPDRKPVKCRWVFAKKSDGRYKAHLVAKGFSQIYGEDYNEVFSPVTRFETVRMLLAYACRNDWEIESLDVKTVFLYGQLDEEIYMEQPEGFKVPGSGNKVYRLLRALYGLKQAALAWNKELHKSLLKLGFKRSKANPRVYYYRDKSGIMLFIVYVDDGLLMSNSPTLLKKKKTAFLKVWEVRDMGAVKEYLGFQIIRNCQKHTMILHQHPYVLKVLKRFQMENVKHVQTPLPSGYQPEKAPVDYNATASDRQQYQSIIGSLLFVMLGTRPDIAFSVIKMSQYMANPTKEHIQKVLHIVKYLGSTPLLALSFTGGESSLDCYCDSDWAGDLES